MESVRSDEIEVFVRSEVRFRKSMPLSVATRLWEDLGQTGDEADDFMGRLFERFPVNASDFEVRMTSGELNVSDRRKTRGDMP
ncbi:DUF1493 family protein [Burkholderia anthina]|uniref:DUF1493 family protein n=1 Tax=Burkholderia anthina TaxID=179879 RepID=UPI0009C030FA|nr:DUF1493 family protein [Burkholderia anthina]